jgi:hypothetical protein
MGYLIITGWFEIKLNMGINTPLRVFGLVSAVEEEYNQMRST